MKISKKILLSAFCLLGAVNVASGMKSNKTEIDETKVIDEINRYVGDSIQWSPNKGRLEHYIKKFMPLIMKSIRDNGIKEFNVGYVEKVDDPFDFDFDFDNLDNNDEEDKPEEDEPKEFNTSIMDMIDLLCSVVAEISGETIANFLDKEKAGFLEYLPKRYYYGRLPWLPKKDRKNIKTLEKLIRKTNGKIIVTTREAASGRGDEKEFFNVEIKPEDLSHFCFYKKVIDEKRTFYKSMNEESVEVAEVKEEVKIKIKGKIKSIDCSDRSDYGNKVFNGKIIHKFEEPEKNRVGIVELVTREKSQFQVFPTKSYLYLVKDDLGCFWLEPLKYNICD